MKIYVIAHTYQDVELTIEHYFTSEKTVKRLGEITSEEWNEKPSPDDSPEEYLSRYNEWVREENDNMCDTVVELEIINI